MNFPFRFPFRPALKSKKPMDVLYVSRYTLDAWLKTQEGGTRENWKDRMLPDQVISWSDLLFGMLKQHTAGAKSIRVCPIDDEYFGWIQQQDMPDTEDARLAYIAQLDDDNTLRLLKKNDLGVQYTVCATPIALFSLTETPSVEAETNYKLTKEEAGELQKYLEGIFGEGAAWVPGYVMDPETLLKAHDSNELVQLSKIWFQEHANARLMKWDTQNTAAAKSQGATNPDITVFKYFIPFVVKGELESPYITTCPPGTKQELTLDPASINFVADDLERFGIHGVQALSECDFYRKACIRLAEGVDGGVGIIPLCLDANDLAAGAAFDIF